MKKIKITRKQFLQVFAAAPALGLIGKGGSFYEIDYEDGVLGYRWIDSAGREVWMCDRWITILNQELVTIAHEFDDYVRIWWEGTREVFDIVGRERQRSIEKLELPDEHIIHWPNWHRNNG